MNNRLPKILTFSLAALIVFYKNKFSNNDKIVLRDYQLNDDKNIINFFSRLSNENDCNASVNKALANLSFWDIDLNCI